MHYRISEFLNSLEHYELLKLRQELENGNVDFGKTLQDTIKEREKLHEKICATCSGAIDGYNSNTYTLIFGPDDFRKKASFCGLDCVEYFLAKLKEIKKEEPQNENR